jgi:hypothetical protein
MAGGAVFGRFALAMTRQASAHIMCHYALSYRCLCQITMASSAGNLGAIVRGVLKFHVRRLRKPIHPLPRNLDVFVGVFNNFLDLRFFPRQLVMAQHAFFDGWYSGRVTNVSARVAVNAAHTDLDMRLMWKRNRLARGVSHSPKPQ